MNDTTKTSRRRFLRGAGAAGAAGALAAASATPRAMAAAPAAAPAAAKADAAQPKGYRLSEHVRRYYRSTMI